VFFALSSIDFVVFCDFVVQVAFLSDLEKNGTDLVVLSDPVAVWPSEVAGKLIHLAKQCTDKDSHSRPLISQVGGK
jgi:hypothetical protein